MAMFLLLFLISFPFANAFQCAPANAVKSETDVLQVHLVPHTHDDVGWLKTVDQYFYGANNSIQNAGVQYILDSVIPALEADPSKHFIYVEIAFFKRWWDQQTPAMQQRVKNLVSSGQLEFINGGWCMNDEASTHYNAIIDQMTVGLQFIQENFGDAARPRVAWHIDPFGHSAEQASLFAQMSFEGFFFARIHYADMKKRLAEQTMELLWRGSSSLSTEIFTGVMYNGYGPPSGFCFDIFCSDWPIQDDPNLFDYNVQERVALFINRSCDQALHYKSGHIMVMMGQDFNYQNANTWYKNLDKLIHYANKDGRINAFYSTPSKYLDAVKHKGMQLEVKTDDFFPYADTPHSYWTGYFTSRPALKYYVRKSNNLLQVCKQQEVLGHFATSSPSSQRLREAMGVAQHHDAVSGTEKQHVAFDYAKRLAIGTAECHMVTNSFLNKHSAQSERNIPYIFCDNLNISVCTPTETLKSFTVAIYNPIARPVDHFVRIPVNSKYLMVYGSDGKRIESVVVPLPDATRFARGGNPGNALYELVFSARQLPPLGLAMYGVNVTQQNRHGVSSFVQPDVVQPDESPDDVIIQNGYLSMLFNRTSGRLVQMHNLVSNVTSKVDQQFFWYNASVGNNESDQASGAYIFRPNSSKPFTVSDQNFATLFVVRTALFEEVRQVFSPWVRQTVRLYNHLDYAEFRYTVGPIKNAPYPDLGKEVISRFDTSMNTSGVFYTDANGREMKKRQRNYRPTWTYKDTEPVAGNYYPINSRAYIRDRSSLDQFTVLTDRSLGGSSLKDGSLEIMVHRRLLRDDKKGVSEALNEPGVDGHGLVVTGRFLVILDSYLRSAKVHRLLGEQEYMQPSLAFAAGHVGRSSYQAMTRALPVNVHLLTLEKFGKAVLLRLEHQFASGEDASLSQSVDVSLKGLFTDFEIVSMTELNLSANKVVSEYMQGDDWIAGVMGNSVYGPNDFIVTLKPMEIKTFKLDVYWK